MADTVFTNFIPNLKAYDNGDGTFSFSISGGITSMPANTVQVGVIDALGETVVITLPAGCSAVALQITGVWTGQIEFEGTVDGINYQSVDVSNGVSSINATTGNDIYVLPGAGYTAIRTRSSVWVIGTANITLIATIGSAPNILTGSLPAGANILGSVWEALTKTTDVVIQAIAEVAALAVVPGTEYNVSGLKSLTLFLYHAKDAAGAAVGQGTVYSMSSNPLATGGDWASVDSWTAALTAPTAVVVSAIANIGDTNILCAGSTPPAVGDKMLLKNATLALSEWVEVVARDATGGSEDFTVKDPLKVACAAGTYYTQAETYVQTYDVRGLTRFRVSTNNAGGTTNKAIVRKALAITVS